MVNEEPGSLYIFDCVERRVAILVCYVYITAWIEMRRYK